MFQAASSRKLAFKSVFFLMHFLMPGTNSLDNSSVAVALLLHIILYIFLRLEVMPPVGWLLTVTFHGKMLTVTVVDLVLYSVFLSVPKNITPANRGFTTQSCLYSSSFPLFLLKEHIVWNMQFSEAAAEVKYYAYLALPRIITGINFIAKLYIQQTQRDLEEKVVEEEKNHFPQIWSTNSILY